MLFNIKNSIDTILYIIENKTSISRFGDGEFQIIYDYLQNTDSKVDTFQKYNKDLGQKLLQAFTSKSQNNHLVGVPYAFRNASVHRGYERIFFERESLYWLPRLFYDKTEHVFYDTNFTRFYMGRKDIKDYPAYINLLKKIWDGQDILFIEGVKSRLGVGNDLFDNARSIERILAPATNAFDRYNEILKAGKQFGNNKLILLALGQTATVLAYDLAKEGFWAIDIGHIDIEYEWYLRKAKTKIAIPGKYVNEVQEGRIVNDDNTNQTYLREIIARIE